MTDKNEYNKIKDDKSYIYAVATGQGDEHLVLKKKKKIRRTI